MNEKSSSEHSNSSSGWSSGASSSSSSGSSSSSSESSSHLHEAVLPLSSVRRRGNGSSEDHSISSSDRNGASRGVQTTWSSLFHRSKKSRRRTLFRRFCGRASTIVLLVCFGVWLVVFFQSRRRNISSNPNLTIQERTKLRTEQNAQKDSFLHQAMDGVWDAIPAFTPPHKAKKKNTEELPPGCERAEWQEKSYPNCNDIHEIDLTSILQRQADKEKIMRTGYIASGLWRSVWAVDPRSVMAEPVALKIMKGKHDLNDRNFDRHRRDAVTMERLTSSPYVVDGYAFCGNSVVTEYLDTPLDAVIYNGVWANMTKITGETRIKWARDMARGIQAMHEVGGGPIVHTDLQAKQFLVSGTGTVKVNDFNRCRFMAAKDGKPCTFRIPTAPGKMRAPEEYAYGALDEQLDMYSVANIFYSILTKKKAWDDVSSTEAKSKIRKGFIPEIDIIDLGLSESIHDALLSLNQRAYALDPKERISASELASELQALLDRL